MIKLRQKVEIAKAADIVGEIIDYNTTLPPVTGGGSDLRGKALYNDKAFRAKLKLITDKYNINDEELLAVMNVETGGLVSSDSLYKWKDKKVPRGNKPFYINSKKVGFVPPPEYVIWATGLIQFTPENAKTFGVTLEKIRDMPAIEQLDYVEKYLDVYQNKLRGQNIYVIYGYVFYPVAVSRIKSGQDSWVIGSDKSYEYALTVSLQNPKIARAAGVEPGKGVITVGGFKRYVDSIR